MHMNSHQRRSPELLLQSHCSPCLLTLEVFERPAQQKAKEWLRVARDVLQAWRKIQMKRKWAAWRIKEVLVGPGLVVCSKPRMPRRQVLIGN